MALRHALLAIGFGITALTPVSSPGQAGANKKDILVALDEIMFDNNRFERLAGFARTLGVSDSRIVFSRFNRAFYTSDLETIKKMLPEFEKALETIPAEEADPKAGDLRKMLPQFKKVLETGDQARVRTVLEKYQHDAEARSILSDLQRIDIAIDICAIESTLKVGTVIPPKDWLKHVPPGSRLRESGSDVFGVAYGNQIVDQKPKANAASLERVSKFVPPDFFDLKSPSNKN